MAKTIEGIPDFITRDQYVALINSSGFDADYLQELRFAVDGIHAVVFYKDENGNRILDKAPGARGWVKHRVFIPVRDDDTDRRRTRVRPVKGSSRE